MNHSEIMKFVLSFFFNSSDFGFGLTSFSICCPLDPDQNSQNLANTDPKHLRIRLKNNLEGIILENIAMEK